MKKKRAKAQKSPEIIIESSGEVSAEKQFEKSGKSFFKNIQNDVTDSAFATFSAFPKKFAFSSLEPDEKVVLVVRKHWIFLVSKFFISFFIAIIPFVLWTLSSSFFDSAISVGLFNTGVTLFCFMVAFSFSFSSFLQWFYEVNIVTTKRVIDVDFQSIMNHRMSETMLQRIQDVSHSPTGALASFFDFGNLVIQTAGEKGEFEFINIPRPRDVQDTILDLMEIEDHEHDKGL